ncbi:hypothetical protein NKR23_g6198 [Pleurostoma richardsiae]|uniref:Uncharacterized protein n=1 Tax=Pleurostoma richardsiae TaxID=41990 RepID=A0AA38RQD5_9PEZI|nr:hypothetical protein NKR23_g6198 [Pleurostoma richardsiae]
MDAASFTPYHIVPLFVASATAFGGLIPFWDPAGAIREFGLPERVAAAKPAHACFVISGARISSLGTAIWIFYLRGDLSAVDTIMALLGYVGVVDGYVCWREVVPSKAVFRAFMGIMIGGWGLLEVSSR